MFRNNDDIQELKDQVRVQRIDIQEQLHNHLLRIGALERAKRVTEDEVRGLRLVYDDLRDKVRAIAEYLQLSLVSKKEAGRYSAVKRSKAGTSPVEETLPW